MKLTLNSYLVVGASSGCQLYGSLRTYESRHDKTNRLCVRLAKTQISLGIRPVWSESSLSAWRKLRSLATHWAQAKTLIRLGDSDRWVHIILLVLSYRGSYISICNKTLCDRICVQGSLSLTWSQCFLHHFTFWSCERCYFDAAIMFVEISFEKQNKTTTTKNKNKKKTKKKTNKKTTTNKQTNKQKTHTKKKQTKKKSKTKQNNMLIPHSESYYEIIIYVLVDSYVVTRFCRVAWLQALSLAKVK